MTREEALILGVGSAKEAESLRDAMMQLVGAFDQHVRDEGEWQARMEAKLDRVPSVMDSKIASCREDVDGEFESIKTHVDEESIGRKMRSRSLRNTSILIGIAAAAVGILVSVLGLFQLHVYLH